MSTIAKTCQKLTIRMLGENITLGYWQWVELLDELRPDSDLAARIAFLIGSPS